MSLSKLKKAFENADPKFGPVPFWWWAGEKVTEERIRWQLQKFRSGGLRNIGIINIAPTGPQYGSISDNPTYFSEEWWEMFEVTVKEANRLDMYVWFYDQIGFSGSNFPARIVSDNPEYAGYLLKRVKSMGEVPKEAEILYKDEKYIYMTIRQGFNWLDPKACESLLDKVHGEFERRFPNDLGKTIVGSFQDELPPLPLWTKEMPQLYNEIYKEDLILQLPALFESNDESEKVRRRVYGIATELVEKAFFIPISSWHDKYNMLLGCDQAGPARRVDIHGAQRLYLDYFRTHRWYSSPGADMDGEVKPHSSMVHLHGGKRVWLEGFHSSGWGGTIEETMHWLIPWIQGGVTLYSPHSVFFSTKGGWWEWAAPDTGWRQPYFEHYSVMADTVSRICSLLSVGRHVADIGVHYPSYAASGYMSIEDGEPSEHPMSVANKMPNKQLEHMQQTYESITGRWNRHKQDYLGALREVKRDFDIIDDSALEKAIIEKDKLRIAEEEFSALILAGTTVMNKAAQDKLEKWIAQGGLVIGVDILKEDQAIEGMIYTKSAEEATQIIDERLPKRIVGKGLTLHRRTEEADIYLLLPDDGNLIKMHKPTDSDTVIQDRATYRLLTKGEPQLWDPVNGKIYQMEYKREGEWVEIEAEFNSWPAAIVVCPTHSNVEEIAYENDFISNDLLEELCIEVPDDNWKLKVIPTLDNTYGDFDLHGEKEMMAPIERRTVKVKQQLDNNDGINAKWHLPEYDDSLWDTRLWSESAYWIASSSSKFEKDQSWKVVYSNTLGDMNFKTWAGRMGRVPRRFLNLGEVEKDNFVWGKSNVISDERRKYWIRIESNAEVTGWINDKKITWTGGPEEQTSWIELGKGNNQIILRAKALVNGLIRLGVEINKHSNPPLPKWIYLSNPTPKSSLIKKLTNNDEVPIEKVRMNFAARGRVTLFVNGETVTEHGDFNPYIRQGQEEVDLTRYWKKGLNEIKFEFPEGEGEVFADGIIEKHNGETEIFYSSTDWEDEQQNKAVILHEAVLQFAETESLWLSDRSHPLPNVGWLMPNSIPDSKPLPFHINTEAIGKPVWLRFPMPIGAKTLKFKCTGSSRVWIDGTEMAVKDGRVSFPVQKAGTIAVICIEPNDGSSEADVLLEPIRFETGYMVGKLGDWRTELHLPHHSGAIEYETTFKLKDNSRAILDIGHVRGTAEVWIDNNPVGVRVWRPYIFDLGENLNGTHRIRIRVTNTLGTHYEVGRPSNVVGGENQYWNQDIDQQGWTNKAAAGGLYGPVRIYQSEKEL